MSFELTLTKQTQLKHVFAIAVTTYIMASILRYYKSFIHVTISCVFYGYS
jgi:thiamine transporter ThiT